MLPVKKRFSTSESFATASPEAAPKPPKRSKICSDDELDLLRLKRDLAFNRLAYQRLSAIPPRHSPTAAPFHQGVAAVTPETMAVTFPGYKAPAPRVPFPQTRRASECIDLTKETATHETKASKNPLDLLSSVSTLVAGRRNSCPESTSTPLANNQVPQPSSSLPQQEKYVGQRHPETGLRHGKGIMRYTNGARYVGYFVQGLRHGYGKCWYANGCVYSGHWENNKRHGTGSMVYVNGDVCDGTWEEDERRGPGVYLWKDGRLDVCTFRGKEFVGEGCRWSKDRKTVWLTSGGEVLTEIPEGIARVWSKKMGIHFP